MTGLDHTRLAAARLRATHDHPYLASAVFASPVIEAPGLGRLTIDRWWRVYADPDVVAAASIEALAGELLHLCTHVLRDHATRADTISLREPAELHHWVDAADAELADDFVDLVRIADVVRAADLDHRDGRLAEEYFRSGSVREGCTNDCGSGAHGQSPAGEPPPPTQRDAGSGVRRDEQQRIRRDVAAAIERDAAGRASGALRAWADTELHAPVDWRHELGAIMRRAVSRAAGAVDYTWSKPSRRAAAVDGVVLAALARPTVRVAVVCDTSASVDDRQLGAAVAEVDALAAATGTRDVHFLACDDAVHVVERVTRRGEVTLAGGGGTDMGAGLAAALDLSPRPDAVVVITDGETPWPRDRPPTEVIVALLEDEAGRRGWPEPPEWARVVRIDAP